MYSNLTKLILWSTFWLLASTAVVDACTCNIRPPACYEYWKTEAIFVGTVSSVSKPEDDVSLENIDVEISESFLGMDYKKAKTLNHEHSCALRFVAGETYLFYANLNKDKAHEFGTSLCTRTISSRFSSFSDDLAFLRGVKEGKSQFWIWGTISEWGYDTPLSGIKAELISTNPRKSGVSDENGNIKIEVAKSGKHKVRVYLPKGRTDVNALSRNDKDLWLEQRKQVVGGRSTGKSPYVDYEVNVQANRCGWFDVSVPRTRTR